MSELEFRSGCDFKVILGLFQEQRRSRRFRTRLPSSTGLDSPEEARAGEELSRERDCRLLVLQRILMTNSSPRPKESFKKVANEKFELIQELTKQNKSYLQLCEDIQLERSVSLVTKSV